MSKSEEELAKENKLAEDQMALEIGNELFHVASNVILFTIQMVFISCVLFWGDQDLYDAILNFLNSNCRNLNVFN